VNRSRTVEAEIGFTQVSEILPYPGAEVGGMLPPDIQSFTSFSMESIATIPGPPKRWPSS
jgi:hypothetical protein